MTSKEILKICKEIKSLPSGSRREWDVDGKTLIFGCIQSPSDSGLKDARLSLEKDDTETGHFHYLYPRREAPQEIPDDVVRLLGDKYISMEITATGQPQEYEDYDDEYDFWNWVIEHNDSCAVYRECSEGTSTLELCLDEDGLDDFCDAYGLEDGYIDAKIGYSGVICVDVSDILPYPQDMEKLWRNRPAGLRTDW